jgi:hypothetical protein
VYAENDIEPQFFNANPIGQNGGYDVNRSIHEVSKELIFCSDNLSSYLWLILFHLYSLAYPKLLGTKRLGCCCCICHAKSCFSSVVA